jgi:hypothetical protein
LSFAAVIASRDPRTKPVQRREGVSPPQGREALVPSARGDQGAAADDELWLDRDRLRLRDAFYLQKLNPSAKVSRWLGEESAALVVASRRETTRTKTRVLGMVETAKDCVRSYLKSKRDAKPGPELIRATVDLAQLDLVYRIGLLDLHPINDAMVEDIGNMLPLVQPDDFCAKRTCVLNPTFGAASELVGGADGELFIDGMLVDIKVNKNLELGCDVFNQIFGYFCLACIGVVDGCRGRASSLLVYSWLDWNQPIHKREPWSHEVTISLHSVGTSR